MAIFSLRSTTYYIDFAAAVGVNAGIDGYDISNCVTIVSAEIMNGFSDFVGVVCEGRHYLFEDVFVDVQSITEEDGRMVALVNISPASETGNLHFFGLWIQY